VGAGTRNPKSFALVSKFARRIKCSVFDFESQTIQADSPEIRTVSPACGAGAQATSGVGRETVENSKATTRGIAIIGRRWRMTFHLILRNGRDADAPGITNEPVFS